MMNTLCSEMDIQANQMNSLAIGNKEQFEIVNNQLASQAIESKESNSQMNKQFSEVKGQVNGLNDRFDGQAK